MAKQVDGIINEKYHECGESWPLGVSIERHSELKDKWALIVQHDIMVVHSSRWTTRETGLVIQYCPFCGLKLGGKR